MTCGNPKRFGWLGVCGALLVLAGARAGAAELQRPSSFPDEFSAEVRPKLVVEVPLVRNEAARLVLSRTLEGLDGAERDRAAEAILGRYAFRSATPEEVAAKRATHVGLATLYADRFDSVRGDGRTVLVGELLVRDREGSIVAIDDVQIQGGVITGLRPHGAKDGDPFHADSAKRLDEGIRDYLVSSFLSQNEIQHAVVEHLFDAGRTTTTRAWLGEGTWTEPTGTFVRRGNFFNLGHLVQLESDPRALREALDHVNRQLSLRLGRAEPLSWGELFTELCKAETRTWAALYFARVQYGSPTLDNTAPLDLKDLGTLAVVDRNHEGFRLTTTTQGFGREGRFVLEHYVARELRSLMYLAGTREERRELPATVRDSLSLVDHLYREQLASHLLEHLGFPPEDVDALLAHDREALLGQDGLLDTAMDLAREQVAGRARDLDWLGLRHPQDERPEVQALRSNPARFNLFGGLAALAAIHGSRRTAEEKVGALEAALEPFDGASERSAEAARQLLAAAAPVLEGGLRHLDGAAHSAKLDPAAVRAAKLALLAAKAAEINRPVPSMYWGGLVTESNALRDLAVQGEDVATRARAFERTLAFRGPRTGHGTAERLRREAPGRVDGKAVLSEEAENGVRLQEVSDGVSDSLRFTLEKDPLGVGPAAYRLWWDAGDGRAGEVASPLRVESGRATFEVPFPAGATVLRAGFTGPDGTAWPGGDGVSVLHNHVFVLGSPLVQAQLARLAREAGRTRDAVSEATRVAAEAWPPWSPRPRPTRLRIEAASVPELRQKLLRRWAR